MLLINYDFYDVHALISDIRISPNKEFHIQALETILTYLQKPVEGNSLKSKYHTQIPQRFILCGIYFYMATLHMYQRRFYFCLKSYSASIHTHSYIHFL